MVRGRPTDSHFDVLRILKTWKFERDLPQHLLPVNRRCDKLIDPKFTNIPYQLEEMHWGSA